MSKRFQLVGSLLRPSDLLQFKRQIEDRDDITYPFYSDFPGYQECEKKSVKAVVDKQIEHGITVLTDGEHTKSLWHLDFVWGLQGVERYIARHGYFFRDKDEKTSYETRKDIGLRIVAPLSGKNHHFIEVFKQLQRISQAQAAKLCIPSPSHILGELSWSDNIGGASSIYKDRQELADALVLAYTQFITDFAHAGGKILQLDDCLWELFADDNPNSPYTGKQINQETVQELARAFIEINNTIIDHGHSLGLQMWTHNCRGNYDSRNMGEGSYEKIADLFLKQLNYDRFFLEWDDERAGSLKALQVFKEKPNVEIVLGLLSSKTHTLDDENRTIRMIEEASQILPKERLFLSHQCGFASCDEGNELSEEEQWAKIDQGQKIAQAFWGE